MKLELKKIPKSFMNLKREFDYINKRVKFICQCIEKIILHALVAMFKNTFIFFHTFSLFF